MLRDSVNISDLVGLNAPTRTDSGVPFRIFGGTKREERPTLVHLPNYRNLFNTDWALPSAGSGGRRESFAWVAAERRCGCTCWHLPAAGASRSGTLGVALQSLKRQVAAVSLPRVYDA
jgi:hypothetical protein